MFTIDRQNDRFSKYLIAATDASTSVFEFKGDKVDSVTSPIFSLHETTVSVGKLKDGEIIAQASFSLFNSTN